MYTDGNSSCMVHCKNCSYSNVQNLHNVYTNTEQDSGIESDLHGIITDLKARVQQRDDNVLKGNSIRVTDK